MSSQAPAWNAELLGNLDVLTTMEVQKAATVSQHNQKEVIDDDDEDGDDDEEMGEATMDFDDATKGYELGDDSLQDFAAITHQWIRRIGEQTGNRKNKRTRPTVIQIIRSAYKQAGGWEIWAQVELTTLINEAYNGVYEIEREVDVYPEQANPRSVLHTDFVLKNKKKPEESLVIELKVEKASSLKGSRREILTEAQSDYKKLKKLNPKYQGYRRVAFAIVCAEDTIAKIQLKNEPLSEIQITGMKDKERQYYEMARNWDGYGVIRVKEDWISLIWQEIPAI